MIWKSGYWKKDLIKDAEILVRWASKPPSNRHQYIFEKKILLTGYVIRKLLEAEKIGSDFPVWNISVSRFPRINKKINIDLFNAHHIESFYDMKSIEKASINLAIMSDIIIHSMSFCLSLNEVDHVDSFLITSDKHGLEYLYKIELKDFVRVLQLIGHSDVISMKYIKTEKDYKIKRTYVFCCISKNILQKHILTHNEYVEQCLKINS